MSFFKGGIYSAALGTLPSQGSAIQYLPSIIQNASGSISTTANGSIAQNIPAITQLATGTTNIATANINSIIYNGVTDYLEFTGGPTGVSDGTTGTFVAYLTFESNNSYMRIYDIPGTVPVLLERKDDNTFNFEVGSNGNVCSATTTAIDKSVGPLMILASFSGTQANLYVISSSGLVSGTPVTGSSNTVDLTSDWFLGSNGGLTQYIHANVHMWWADDSFIRFVDSDNVEQFWNTTSNIGRYPGVNGANPTDGIQPLVCLISDFANAVDNFGSSANANTGTVSGPAIPIGEWASDYVP